MTRIKDIDMKCSVCGETSSQRVLLSTNSSGYPDLDLRPSEMQRSTMSTWVMECPHCGYVASYLDHETEISRDFLKTDEYMTCDGFEFEGKLSARFYRNHLILKESGDMEGCFFNLLHCAWDCDDKKDTANAVQIRKIATDYIDRIIPLKEGGEKNNLLLMKADLLRRSGEFDQVKKEYEDVIFGDEILNRVVAFQIQKAKLGDDACYTVKDVMETP